MRILWFTNTPSCYNNDKNGYNGGGWISSLEKEIKKKKDIELAICFLYPHNRTKEKIENTTYYPIKETSKVYYKLFGTISSIARNKDNKDVNQYLKVIEDFKPDIINIFGSENNFGLISKYVDIPIILHIQGILTPSFTAYYPPGFSFYNTLSNKISPIEIYKKYREQCKWKYRVKREQNIFKNIKFFMGRTEWDKRLTEIYAPHSKYYHCNEILRDEFYKKPNGINRNRELIITTTISSPYYKGFDTILQAAYILKNQLKQDFTWHVFGINDIKIYEKKLGIIAKECNIKINGITNSENLYRMLSISSVFVHPSYIDNSPNSVCEAQILGCPVIATNVGGISSLIKNNETGYLIPANDPYQMAYLIREIYQNEEHAKFISLNGQMTAKNRHNKEEIINTIINIYNDITKTQ